MPCGLGDRGGKTQREKASSLPASANTRPDAPSGSHSQKKSTKRPAVDMASRLPDERTTTAASRKPTGHSKRRPLSRLSVPRGLGFVLMLSAIDPAPVSAGTGDPIKRTGRKVRSKQYAPKTMMRLEFVSTAGLTPT